MAPVDANDEYLSKITRNVDRNYQATVSGVSYGRIRATVRNTGKKILILYFSQLYIEFFPHNQSPMPWQMLLGYT